MPPSLPGLTQRDADARLAREGPNQLPSARPRHALAIARDVLREPMLLLLLATGGLYLVLGAVGDALALVGASLVIVGITFIQERKTERTLHALRDLSSPRALVVRDGVPVRIPGAAVVTGDLLLVDEGDRVAADGDVLESAHLRADESLLTGESVPVAKHPATVPEDPGGGILPTRVYSGTLIVGGHAHVRVIATGAHTELGRIGQSLQGIETTGTRLQREVGRVVRILAALGLGACALVAVTFAVRSGEWLGGILAGLTLAISMVPEEFPVILTIFLALGAWRLSQRQVLTRRFPAIEALGAATVLCVDKTGTLTLNRMRVTAVDTGRGPVALDSDARVDADAIAALAIGRLAVPARAVDPMDVAFLDAAEARQATLLDDGPWTLAREYPLSDHRLAVACAWHRTSDGRVVVAAKGAPEAVARLCRFDADTTAAHLAAAHRLAAEGQRVLAVAIAPALDAVPQDLDAAPFEWRGLTALADPIRPGVPEAVASCHAAGVRVAMLTGDAPTTALAIARHIGLDTSAGALTGTDLDTMDAAALTEAVRHVQVYARVVPAQKLRLIRALQSTGAVVAMTGDGVNDAPALKAADIGIAMGLRGTDVAREAGALVLLDDDFTSIAGAIRQGRRIADNIRKATGYVLAIHVPIAGLSLIPPLLGWPLVLLPLHVIFMELIVDPTCSLAFEAEPEEGNVMARPPRHADDRLFDRTLVVRSLLQGAGMLVASLAACAVARAWQFADTDVRTIGFVTVILSNLLLILANRSLTHTPLRGTPTNPTVRAIALLALAALAAVVWVPPLRRAFSLAPLHLSDLLVCAAAAAGAFLWMAVLSQFTRRAELARLS